MRLLDRMLSCAGANEPRRRRDELGVFDATQSKPNPQPKGATKRPTGEEETSLALCGVVQARVHCWLNAAIFFLVYISVGHMGSTKCPSC